MSTHFIAHEPCPRCLSRDNLGRWSDGHAYCFGCGYYEHGQRSINELRSDAAVQEMEATAVTLFSEKLPDVAYKWLKKYGITDDEIHTHSIYYLPAKDYLAFGFDRTTGRYQTARYFGGNPKHPKYIHHRAKDFLVLDSPIASCPRLIFVEDFVSAIKVSRYCSSSPVFGSTVGLERFHRASKRFKTFGIWLDTNMHLRALREASRARSVGFDCRGSILGKYPDPKDHSDEEIKQLINELFQLKVV